MIYCVSDIHGDLDKLERMMELITSLMPTIYTSSEM